MNGTTTLYAVGINHKTTSVKEREVFQISKKEIPASLREISSHSGVEGVLILATCNRSEFYLSCVDGARPLEIISDFYKKTKNIDSEKVAEKFYVLENGDVTRHLFRVICGLESLVLGEYQIQGQVKEAYSLACKAETMDKLFHKLLHAAFRVGKKVRAETGIGGGKQSVAGVASKVMLERLSPGAKITIIGVNENSKIVAQALFKAGFRDFIFANRTIFKAEMMAADYGGKATELSKLESNLFKSDAVFSSTGASDYIISKEVLRKLVAQERCPKLIFDMAVPRDIDASELPPEYEVYDVSALKEYLERQEEEKLEHAAEAEKLIEAQVDVFQAWTDSRDNEIINPYAEKFEILRQQLLEENRKAFSEQTMPKIDKLTRSLAHRMQSVFVNILIKRERESNGK